MTEQERYENMVDEIIDLKNEIKDLQAKNERLQDLYQKCAYEREMFLNELNDAKAEAYKEFVEKFIEVDGYNNHIFDDCASILVDKEYVKGRDEKSREVRTTVYNLLKELVGDTEEPPKPNWQDSMMNTFLGGKQ
jgi:molecular chaperone GrpE (heat shock protein)